MALSNQSAFVLSVSLLALLLSLFLATCSSSLLPEDYVTDNEEQLERLKRENFLESILKHIPFFGGSSSANDQTEQQHSDDKKVEESKEGTHINDDATAQHVAHDEQLLKNVASTSKSATIIPLMSSIRSSSSFLPVVEVRSIKLSSSINATKSTTTHFSSSVSLPASHANKKMTSSSTSSLTIGATGAATISSTTVTVSLLTSPTSVLLKSSFSSIFKDSVIASNKTRTASITNNFPVSSMIISTAALPSPSSPSPRLRYPPLLDTAPLTSATQQQTVFSSSSASNRLSSTRVLFSDVGPQSSPPGKRDQPNTKPTDWIAKEETQMPTLPDEKGFGDTVYKLPTTNKEKEVSFVYLNILLPIVSGIAGALLITFSIMLFRCCRRRKLKKVRYFGGKPSSDFVRLDKMNLLTDTSDEDDFD
eukprot:gene20085-22055_t